MSASSVINCIISFVIRQKFQMMQIKALGSVHRVRVKRRDHQKSQKRMNQVQIHQLARVISQKKRRRKKGKKKRKKKKNRHRKRENRKEVAAVKVKRNPRNRHPHHHLHDLDRVKNKFLIL